jgi:hypothetical protein
LPNSPASKSSAAFHTSTAHLEADNRSFIDRHNADPKPFRWSKSADEILVAVKRFCQKTEQTLCGEPANFRFRRRI